MGVLWGKIGEEVVRYWPLTNSFFLLRVLTYVPILVKIDEEMRPWECSQTDRQTDRLTHWQTQTDFIICPMLYAIAMGQIKSSAAEMRRSGGLIITDINSESLFCCRCVASVQVRVTWPQVTMTSLILIRGGRVVNDDRSFDADVLIENDVIR